MLVSNHSSYAQATWFDQLYVVLRRSLRRGWRGYGHWLWSGVFAALATGLCLVAGTLVYRLALAALLPGAAGALEAARLGGTVLAFAGARHFLWVALDAAPVSAARRWKTPATLDRLSAALMLGVVAAVLVAVMVAAAYAEHPMLAVGFLATLISALAAGGVFYRGLVQRQKTAAAAAVPANPVSTPEPAPTPTASAAPPAPRPAPVPAAPSGEESWAYLETLRAAGINVRVAKALFMAGFRSAQALREADDAALLAIQGVGPATLSKVRVRFGRCG